MSSLRRTALRALTVRAVIVLAVAILGGSSCTKGTGPELDARTRDLGDARGSGGFADGGVPRDGAADAPGSGPLDAGRRDAAPDAMPDAPLGP